MYNLWVSLKLLEVSQSFSNKGLKVFKYLEFSLASPLELDTSFLSLEKGFV